MTKLEKLEKVLKEQEDKNEKTFDKASWCREHKFQIQADVLMKEYDAIRQIHREIRMKVIEEILDV